MTATKLTPLQQAFHVIRDLESRVFSLTAEPIAILGMSCRLPGSVASPEDFWRLLSSGQDATSEVSPERFDVASFYDPDPKSSGKMYTRRAGMLDSIDTFDARFFGISPREAILMDPQQRMLLEVSWEALERSGLAPHRLEKSATGVFVAASPSDYLRRHSYAGKPKDIDVYDGTGNATCFSAGRLSYLLGLEGPSFTVDTACSSSLLAVHLACQSLRAGESDVAIAAGVNLIVSPETFIFLSRAGNISPDGRSKTFDASADGYGRGEGCGVVVLKRLSRARADGDPILAVLRGSAVNHDGASSGLTVPNGLAQQAVIRRACQNAGIEPRSLDYVEAHGTATLLGDPIELDALGAIAEGRTAEKPLWVGSVKSNLGHLETAAGITGLMKAVLMLQHKKLPASLHFSRPNPHVDWQRLPLRVPTQLTDWSSPVPLIAGVSSFGLSGTNVHVILEEARDRASEAASLPAAPATAVFEPSVLLLSARTPSALQELADTYRRRLALPEFDAPLQAIVHTAALRRSHHEHRLAISGTTREAWIAALDAFRDEAAHPGVFSGRVEPGRGAKLTFVFSGQGSQWVGMGRELFAASEVFRDSLRATAAALAPHGVSILDAFQVGAPPPELAKGEVVQPLLFAIQVAIAQLWRSWGIEPAAVTGHSVGEISAAHVAGALTLEDAALLVAVRSQLLMRISNQGGMAMIELPAAEVEKRLARYEPHLSIGAVNAPGSTVASGQLAAIEALLAELSADGVFARRVKIDVASHSPQVAPILDEFRRRLVGLRPRNGGVPMISTVTGGEVEGSSLNGDYWARNLRQMVRFADAVATLDRTGYGRFLEISPHPILAVAIEQTLGERRVIAASLRRGQPDLETLGESLAMLHASGHPVDWSKIFRSAQPSVLLPTYPWQRERYWEAARSSGSAHVDVDASGASSLAGQQVLSPGDEVHFVDRFQLAEYPYLEDHRIFDDVVVPGAFHLAAVLSVARELVGSDHCVLEAVTFPQALVAGPNDSPAIHLTALPRDGGKTRFRRASLAVPPKRSGSWDDHVTGFITRLEPAVERAAWAPGRAASAAVTEIEPAAFYERNTRRGIELGPTFRWIRQLWTGPREARSILARPAALTGGRADSRSLFHPAQLDAVFQTIAAAVPESAEHAYVPFSVDRLEVYGGEDGGLDEPLHCLARYQPGDDESFLIGDAAVLASDDRVVARVEGLRLRRVSRAALSASGRPAWSDWLYETRWDRQPLAAAAQIPVGGRWLLFADTHGVADRLAEQLRARGDECVTVAAGDAFARVTASSYVVAPSRRADFEQLVAALAGGAPLREVVFLWGLSSGPLVSESLAWPAERAARDAAGLLHVTQAIATASLRDPPRLSIVTRGAQRVGDETGAMDIAAAMLWGMARSFLHERPMQGFARIDLDPANEGLEALLGELVSREREEEVLFRNRLRHVGRVARSARLSAANGVSVRSDGGSYLITGGLGGLGLRLANWLAESGAKHLVLVGRRGVESEAQREALNALHARGTIVEVVAADVADRAQVAHAADRARQLGPLRGIIHAAGVVDDGLLEQQTPERYQRVLAPKVLGALHLHELTREAELDFFVLFSSAAALIGAPGQSNYAAANAALDAIALSRRARGLPALSVNWGTFSEVGMATMHSSRGERLAHRGILSMSPAEGLAALGGLLERGAAHVAVMALEPRHWIESSPHLARSKRFSEIMREVQQGGSARTKLRDLESLRVAPPKELRSRLALLLRQEIGRVLRLDAQSLEPQAPLMSLGFDSLLSLELRNRLESLFGLTFPAVLLWTYPTLDALTEHLAQQLQPAREEPAPLVVESAATSGKDLLEEDSQEDELDDLTEAERALIEERLASLVKRL
ncbi:type I polyketide synthase [Stigmatella aurantiaca]|uniref:Polyketide synthase AufC n=3 Tax=Stigmatella aurantiaca TaxID=41 RepID=A8YP92_STIAU|nr:type I polyketide synthase [Stigmatella aurantiaca]ADO72987.1 Polyketide synthase AufC [Stigmatella aurantiaca DW4/3-1]CAO98847.1 polyketide synthase AufC [Stigmatella aurantiaca DW4/3-1]